MVLFTTGPAVRIAASAPQIATTPRRDGGPPGLPTWTRQVMWHWLDHWLGDWLGQWTATGFHRQSLENAPPCLRNGTGAVEIDGVNLPNRQFVRRVQGAMFDEDGGSGETETPGGSLDPIAVATAAAGLFEHHPLFPREDGLPETRDIQFVSFCRKRTGDQAMQNCPEDIPAHEVKSWAQVVEWWGGGEYKAIAKNGKHRMVAWFPNTGGEWLVFDGDSKPFTLRNGKGYRAPGPTSAPPSADAPPSAPAPAPIAQDDLRGILKEVLQELRNPRVVQPPAAPANDGALVAMIQAQAAQATATSQANTQMMQTLLTVVAQRPAENAARPAEPTTLALQLIGAVQKLVPAPVAQPGLAEQIPSIKALRDLSQPAAPTNELQPFVDIFGQVMAADAASKQAEAARAQTTSKPQEPPAPRPPPRPRPELVHVPGLGMVEVVAPDAGARRFGEASTEERAAAVRKDPALLRELGIGLPPSVVAPAAHATPASPAPTSPASLVAPAVVASVPAIPAVPDLRADTCPGGRGHAAGGVVHDVSGPLGGRHRASPSRRRSPLRRRWRQRRPRPRL